MSLFTVYCRCILSFLLSFSFLLCSPSAFQPFLFSLICVFHLFPSFFIVSVVSRCFLCSLLLYFCYHSSVPYTFLLRRWKDLSLSPSFLTRDLGVLVFLVSFLKVPHHSFIARPAEITISIPPTFFFDVLHLNSSLFLLK